VAWAKALHKVASVRDNRAIAASRELQRHDECRGGVSRD
jgi:hypothetical protein